MVNIGIDETNTIARIKNGYITNSKLAREISRIEVVEAVGVSKIMGINVDNNVF